MIALHQTFLTQDNRCFTVICSRQTALHIVPLSWCIADIQVDTFLLNMAGFSICPCRIPARYWSAIDPVKYIVSLSVKSNPCTQRLYHLLLLQNFKNKVILIFCSDYSEVSSQILTTRSRVAPVRGRSVDDVLTRISMTNPILWTT